MFTEEMKKVINNDYNSSITENGAKGYKSQGSKLVDINFATASMRHMNEQSIIDKFMDAYYENPVLAIKWLFYLSDVREGLGERRSFRIIMNHIANEFPEIAAKIVNLIPEYSRWDNLIQLIDCKKDVVSEKVKDIIRTTLQSDIKNMREGKPITLLAKWLPSENASSKATKELAHKVRIAVHSTPREYRKMLSTLRKYLDVVECKMSAKEWDKIKYENVPSKANIKYRSAFLRNDRERRLQYIDSLKKGETKINSTVLFPHDIVSKYTCGQLCVQVNDYDETLEQLWKNLPEMSNLNNTIVVADGSGSMTVKIDPASNTTALDVANGLAIYCAERCTGEFKDKYITFSKNPRLVDFSNATTLREKIQIALRHNEISNTDVKAVFNLLLETAKINNMTQDQIPKNILIISDMEFDDMTRGDITSTLFEAIDREYREAGYVLPRLIFWNVCSRTLTIPVKEHKSGVTLVSGFSINVLNMIASGELDPYKCLVNELNKDRYKPIENVIAPYFYKKE